MIWFMLDFYQKCLSTVRDFWVVKRLGQVLFAHKQSKLGTKLGLSQYVFYYPEQPQGSQRFVLLVKWLL